MNAYSTEQHHEWNRHSCLMRHPESAAIFFDAEALRIIHFQERAAAGVAEDLRHFGPQKARGSALHACRNDTIASPSSSSPDSRKSAHPRLTVPSTYTAS